MFKLISISFLLLCAVFTSTNTFAQNKKPIKPITKPIGKKPIEVQAVSTEALKNLEVYPKEKEGYDRYVILLPSKGKEEGNYKLELLGGKYVDVDCNSHFIDGDFTERMLEGYQYPYYEFNSQGNIGSTMMMCPDKTLTNKFIAVPSSLMRYNSRLPVVVFVPKGFKIEYKIWHTESKTTKATIK